MNTEKILLVDDERAIRLAVRTALTREGMQVTEAADGSEALELLKKQQFHLVILDVMMEHVGGYDVLQAMRAAGDHTPVMMLSGKSDEMDQVLGLGFGADSYLTKPFHLEELEARIRSLTRRRFTQNNVVLNCGKIAFDTKARVAVADGQELSLTRKEIGILEYLLLNQGRPVSQEELLDHVWDNSVDNFSNSIRVHISALRKKLRAALGYDPIRNRIGEGYVMEEEKI